MQIEKQGTDRPMGGKSSKLRKEIEALKADAASATSKHNEVVETLRNEKRMLEFKLQALQEMTAQAQVTAEKATQLAQESEEKMKALKWELVRRISVPSPRGANGGMPVSPMSSDPSRPTSSLSSLGSNSLGSSNPRIPVNWKLKDGVTLTRSNTSHIPRSARLRPDIDLQKANTEKNVNTGISKSEVVKQDEPLQNLDRPKTHIKTIESRASSSSLHSSSNQDELKDLATVPSAPLSVATVPSLVASVGFDKFAPVKRRSLNERPVPAPSTPEGSASAVVAPVADAKPVSFEPVSRRSSKRSESDREQSFSSVGSSRSDYDAKAAAPAAKGVHAATKNMTPHESKSAASDDVLALSEDEEE